MKSESFFQKMGKLLFLCWPCIAWTWLIHLFIHVTCVMIRNPPANVTVLQGRDVTFNCDVREKRPNDYVFWKKVTRAGFVDILSYNRKVTNGSKYGIQGSYSLTVKDVGLEDEAWYECQAGVDRVRAMLHVLVMMKNMTLTWGLEPPFKEEQLVNLTCHVTLSRPAADITWFHGQTELTGLASTCKQSNNVDGYGNTTSTLTILMKDDTDSTPYKCVASFPHSVISRTEAVFANKVAGYTSGSLSCCRVDKYLIFALAVCVQMIAAKTILIIEKVE